MFVSGEPHNAVRLRFWGHRVNALSLGMQSPKPSVWVQGIVSGFGMYTWGGGCQTSEEYGLDV